MGIDLRNIGKWLAPIMAAVIQGQMTANTPGLSKRDKVVKIALDSLSTVDVLDGEGEDDQIDEAAATAVLQEANDLFYEAEKLKARGEALLATLRRVRR